MDRMKLATMVEGAITHSAQSDVELKRRAVVVMTVDEGRVYLHRGGRDPRDWQCLDVLLSGLSDEDTAEAIERMIVSLWPECPKGTQLQLVSVGHAISTSGMLAGLFDGAAAPREKIAPRASEPAPGAISDPGSDIDPVAKVDALMGQFFAGHLSQDELLRQLPEEMRPQIMELLKKYEEKPAGEGSDGGSGTDSPSPAKP